MANLVLTIGKEIEVAAKDALAFFSRAEKAAPGVVAALTVLVADTEKALNDVAADAANPTSALVTFSAQLADLKAEIPAVKAFLESLGAKF